MISPNILCSEGRWSSELTDESQYGTNDGVKMLLLMKFLIAQCAGPAGALHYRRGADGAN